ncbi:uncharacterized protein LOC111364198 [Spodoptera litura]|uniref:Uncharacterized protein LOC111364198 n=1 Tax=Spodoptera litura TaxID=69820 RepID=A0A9J7J057_SPOLT|nr:uncharacterized protein LOC111364198 [Spodoptera litura]
MSGYLEIKYPFKSNLGLNPFKSWKRQWCILRPSPTCSGASLAVYCSEAGASAGSVELPLGCVVKRAKSRTRPHAFAVFSVDEPRKPRILLAAQSLHDTQVWMEKIRALLNGSKILDNEPLLKDSYSVSVVATELSRKCGLSADTVVTLTSAGVVVARAQLATFLEWKHIRDVRLTDDDKNRTCVLTVDSAFSSGGGELRLRSPLAGALARAVRAALPATDEPREPRATRSPHKLSKSDGDLRSHTYSDTHMGDVRRSSWYSGPSEVSLDDIDLVMSKESKHIPVGQLSRYSGEGQLSSATALAQPFNIQSIASFDDSMSDRRSLLSVASGIYEEIPDLPEGNNTNALCTITCDVPDGVFRALCAPLTEEPTYECVGDCVYATMRRRRPPPLPPRHPFSTLKPGVGWARVGGGARGAGGGAAHSVTRHSSLGSLPRAAGPPGPASHTNTLPKRQPFSVFRKRLKSDSRITGSQKSETSKENKDVETKKKKFDFTPTRDIFKSFKVSRKMKNLKITSGNLAKGETKSCDFLDDTDHVQPNRCSKSVECLENDFEYEADLSIELTEDSMAALTLPQQIVDLLLGHEQMSKVRLKDQVENDYMPMSPIIPPAPMEHHYIVMSPRTNIA